MYRVEALDPGCNDRLLNPLGYAELLARMRAVRRGTARGDGMEMLGVYMRPIGRKLGTRELTEMVYGVGCRPADVEAAVFTPTAAPAAWPEKSEPGASSGHPHPVPPGAP